MFIAVLNISKRLNLVILTGRSFQMLITLLQKKCFLQPYLEYLTFNFIEWPRVLKLLLLNEKYLPKFKSTCPCIILNKNMRSCAIILSSIELSLKCSSLVIQEKLKNYVTRLVNRIWKLSIISISCKLWGDQTATLYQWSNVNFI